MPGSATVYMVLSVNIQVLSRRVVASYLIKTIDPWRPLMCRPAARPAQDHEMNVIRLGFDLEKSIEAIRFEEI